MSLLPFDSAFLAPLLSDAETAELLDDRAQLRAMLVFEAALAQAEGRSGIIPEDAAARIAAVAEKLEIDPAALAEDSARDGIPVPALVAELRKAVAEQEGGGEAAHYVHWGTTTQDVMDTGLVLRLRRILDIFDKRLLELGDSLAKLADAERTTVMLARTRGQQATPTSFGLKVAGWLAPLDRHRARLAELRPRLEVLSFGGAAGNLSALGERGTTVEAALAKELGLALPPLPWHSQRDGLVELGNWLGLVSGSLGKLAGDILLLCQNEVGELREGAGGGSSTLPQKQNPVRSEAVLSLTRHVAGLTGQMQMTSFHAHERDGVAWQMEWLVLPQMLVATGAALRRSLELLDGLQVDRAKMRANIEATGGLTLAEAASFALSAHLPRPEAQALVKDACKEAIASGRPLMEILAERSEAPVEWQALADPALQLGAAEAFIDRVLHQRR
ncbi:3-carboxy-cis,cis-muconate cycloisomerase [Pelagibius marinus]|uniref:3-carboxy-cis,cis-muconate cycloisomerase n=1 Tax=Pelagibius marinus TaxID=2762760 RepID=UPI001872456B|nr:3-carboxy-cis,cis-muconate cycloisomerase [Pelagibius marinus]